MKWAEITLTIWRDAVEPVSNILHELDAGGVVIEDPQNVPQVEEEVAWEAPEQVEKEAEKSLEDKINIIAYLPWDENFSTRLRQLTEEIKKLQSYGVRVSTEAIFVSKVDEEDWSEAWKEYYQPVNIGDIHIQPSWLDAGSDEQVNIVLDPGMAFGTGTHPTTVMCLRHLQHYLKGGETVLDFGCGSGILSIAAAKLGASQVHAFDIDTVACRVAKENMVINQVDDKVSVQQKDARNLSGYQADLIMSNIVAEIVMDLAPKIVEFLAPGGYFIGSGITRGKKDQVRALFLQEGLKFIQEEQTGDWFSLVVQNEA